mgnify:CR=1 FL=1
MQLEFFDVPSPCVGVCQSDEKGLCKGCLRTRDERQQWISLSSDDKQKVIKRCVQRKKRQAGVKKAKEEVKAVEITQPSLLDPQPKTLASASDDMDFGDFEL